MYWEGKSANLIKKIIVKVKSTKYSYLIREVINFKVKYFW